MKFRDFLLRSCLFIFVLVVGFLDSTTDPLAAPLASQDRLQPYAVPGTAVGEGLILSHTLDSPGGGYFGYAIAVGDVNNDDKADIAVGAPCETIDGRTCQGRAYVYSGADGSHLSTLVIPDPNPWGGDFFGESIAIDTNGVGDIAVGAGQWDGGGWCVGIGRVHVYSGSGSLRFILDIPEPPNCSSSTLFGKAVAVGDLNGGRSEIVVGASWKNGSASKQGRVYVFSGSGSLLFTLNPSGDLYHAYFGYSVAVGDLDGEGDGEIVVGAPGQGRTYVYSGNGSPRFVLNAKGSSVAIGDVNGDGKGDVAVTGSGESTTKVFYGEDGLLLYTLGAGGGGVAIRDMDGDGKGDIIVGSPAEELAYVFSGADGLLLYRIYSPNPEGGSQFGNAVAAGDVDGDALREVVVGARYEGSGEQGRAYVFSGIVAGAGYIIRAPCCSLPVSLTEDKVLLSSDLGAGPALSIFGAQVHDRFSWRYYDPNGDPWADADGCFMEFRGPGEQGNDTPYDALVTNCPADPGEQWGVLEAFPDGCPCTPQNVWTLGMPIAGHWSASQTGTWTAYIDYTDPGGTTTPGVIQVEMEMVPAPAVMLVHGWEADCDDMSTLQQNLQNELGIPSDRLDCYEYDSRKGIEDPAKGLGNKIREFRQSLGLGADEEVDLVAHSQGGLVARYYRQFEWTSADGPIGSISMIGTPNEGVRIAKLKDPICTAADILLWPFDGCEVVSWGALQLTDIDLASQAVADMTPGSDILLKMNNGFVLPEMPIYRAHAGIRSTEIGKLISGYAINDCAIGRPSVGGPGNVFAPAPYDLTHAVVSFLDGCEEPTLNSSPEIADDVAVTIKSTPPGGGFSSAEGNIASQTLVEKMGGAEPIISSVFDYVTPAGSKNHTISVPSGLGDTAFVVYWLDSNTQEANLGVTLRRPDGQVVNPEDPDVIQQAEIIGDGMFYVLLRGFVMSAPQVGDWQITVDGLSTPEEGQAYLVSLMPMDSQVGLGASAADRLLPQGQPEVITAAMFDGEPPIGINEISAQVTLPTGDQVDVSLQDNGIGGDETAGDYVYSGTFESTEVCGVYVVTVNATANSSEGTVTRQQFVSFSAQVPGDAIRDSCNPDDDEDGLTDYDELNVVLTDPLDPDTDDDGYPDDDETDKGSDPLRVTSTPEHCDGQDNDGDTETDEGYDWTRPGGGDPNGIADCLEDVDTDGDTALNPVDDDDDGDDFSDVDERWMSTDELDDCPELPPDPPNPWGAPKDDAWPPDIDNDADVDIVDVLQFKPHILTQCDDLLYERRLDLDADCDVDIADVLKLKPYILTSCT